MGKARPRRKKPKPTCSIYAMARSDERSMSRDELAQSMPCEEEEDKVKTKGATQGIFGNENQIVMHQFLLDSERLNLYVALSESRG